MTSETPVPPPPSATEPTPDERTWGMLAHLSSVVAMLIGLSVIGPLIVWLAKKDTSAWVAHHAREALNFQITMLLVYVALIIVGFVSCGIGWFPIPVAALVNLVLSIVAAVKANDGVRYTYPFALRLVN
jgi:uncharacterized Tic20 family protein